MPSDNMPPVSIAFELLGARIVAESIRAAIEQKRLIFKVELPAGAFQKSRAEKEYDAATARFRSMWRDGRKYSMFQECNDAL